MLLLSIYVLYSNISCIYPVSCLVEIKLLLFQLLYSFQTIFLYTTNKRFSDETLAFVIWLFETNAFHYIRPRQSLSVGGHSSWVERDRQASITATTIHATLIIIKPFIVRMLLEFHACAVRFVSATRLRQGFAKWAVPTLPAPPGGTGTNQEVVYVHKEVLYIDLQWGH